MLFISSPSNHQCVLWIYDCFCVLWLLICFIFLDSTFKWSHAVFVFLQLAYFHKWQGFLLFSNTLFVIFLIMTILTGVRWLSHCAFDLHFPDFSDGWCWVSFLVSVGHVYVFFRKMSIQILWQYFNQVACFFLMLNYSSLYILDIKQVSNQ